MIYSLLFYRNGQASSMSSSRCEGAYSDLTLSGYRKDLEIFARWCAENGEAFLPADPRSIASFFNAQLETCSYAAIMAGPPFRGLHTGALGQTHLETSSIRRLMKAAARRADLPNQAELLSGHSMRVGAAQDMLRMGCDALAIMTAGGWKNFEVVSRYVEWTPDIRKFG